MTHLFDSAKQGTASPGQGDELDAEGSSSAADINCQQVTCYRNRAALAE